MKLTALLFGIAFGMLVTLAGFTHYDVIHEGLLLHNANIFLVMGSCMVVAMGLLWWMEQRQWITPMGGKLSLRRVRAERKHVFGGILFGIGWAVSGTCPAVSAAMFGSGFLMGGVVMIGLFIGTLLRDLVVRQQMKKFTDQSATFGSQEML